MKKYLFIATALVALASCSDDTFVGENSPNEANGNGAISFGFNVPNITRGTSTDAGKLSNQFIVWGEKNETDANVAVAAGTNSTGESPIIREGDLVFKNYIVNWVANPNSTTSNSHGWEYVGFKFDDGSATIPTTDYTTNVTPNTKPTSGDIPAQTIKYWDDNATSYTFTAVSAKPADISAGRVSITKTQTGDNVYGKGYTVTLTKTAGETPTYPSLKDLYFADRVNIAKGEGYSHNVVEFNFRNVLSWVRVGMFETIPGYEVSEIHFYKTNGSTEYNDGASTPVPAFGAVCPNVSATNFEGTVTATYYDATNTTIQNRPKITVTPNTGVGNEDLVLGTNFSTLTVGDPDATPAPVAAKFLGTTATAPTYDTDGGAFTSVLPQVNNTGNLQLKVNYKLYNTITKETIQITGKTAVIPAEYLQWKANYKYTYLFKITDDDLNPITFDAVVVETENGQAEYITTVSEPSITTFGVVLDSESKFKNYVTGNNEYQLPGGTDKLDIYTTFMQGANVLTPQLTEAGKANYVKVYSVDYKANATDAEKAEKPITELSVANAIEHTGGIITATDIISDNATYFTVTPAMVGKVLAEDGTEKTIDALKLTGIKKDGKYAVEIVTYEAVTLTTGADLTGYYSVTNDTYSIVSSGTYSSGTYYKRVKTYKVITVEAAPSSGRGGN